jgi:hypothetical protein
VESNSIAPALKLQVKLSEVAAADVGERWCRAMTQKCDTNSHDGHECETNRKAVGIVENEGVFVIAGKS